MRVILRHWVALIFLTALASAVVDARAQTTDAATLSVDDPRPVEAAVLSLLQQYAVSVTYEDARYTYSGDLQDVTDQVNRTPGKAKVKTVVPRGGPLQSTYRVSRENRQLADPMQAIQAVVDAQNARSQGAKFKVYRSGETLHIVPVEVRDSNGTWIKQESILDTPITFSSSEGGSRATILKAILNEVGAATGATFKLGLAPIAGPGPPPGRDAPLDKIEANGEPAREVLTRFLRSIGPRLTWVLNWEPVTQSYWFKVVTSAAPAEPQIARSPSPQRPPTPSRGGPASVQHN